MVKRKARRSGTVMSNESERDVPPYAQDGLRGFDSWSNSQNQRGLREIGERLTLASLYSPAEKLFARVAMPPKGFPPDPTFGVLLPPITPNIPAGDPRPESG